jgi:hypothetical protein
MEPIKATCHRDFYPAYRKQGTRSLEAIIWIVLHSAEAPTAKGVARYFQGPFPPKQGGSTHLVVDDNECQRCLRDKEVPWGAKGANYAGFHIEQCGWAKWRLFMWRRHFRTVQRAAYKTAYHCHKFGIPPIYRKAAALKDGKPGITIHRECSKAFGGSHWDPGYFWPRRLFMMYVRQYLSELRSSDGTAK